MNLNRRDFVKMTGGAALFSSLVSQAEVVRGLARDGSATTIPVRVISRTQPLRWEDALVSGNGSTGIMLMGFPLEDLLIVNHAKLWAVGAQVTPRAPDLREAWKTARKMAQEGRYRDADEFSARKRHGSCARCMRARRSKARGCGTIERIPASICTWLWKAAARPTATGAK